MKIENEADRQKVFDKWDLPIGFSMALCENLEAMKVFVSLPKKRRDRCIERARAVNSKAEMQRLADEIASTRFVDFIADMS